MDVVRLRDVLSEMDGGNPFSIVFYTGSLTENSGGKKISIDRAISNAPIVKTKAGKRKQDTDNYQSQRAPNHTKNRTRNIKIMSSGEIRKVHYSLITEFNGKKVVY